MLADGCYEGLVVDVAARDGIVLSIVVTDGEQKGNVVDVRSAALHDDAIDLLGMPCVLNVVNGEPSVVFD